MTRTTAHALAAARPVIRGLIFLNALYALVITGLLVFSFFIQGWPQRPLGFDLTHVHPMAGTGLRAIVVVGVIGAAIAAAVWEPGRFDAFSFAPWLAVLLLFVLAGVFARGARMREDLAGTV